MRVEELTIAQEIALRLFASYEGRAWKFQLRSAWETGVYPSHVTIAHNADLQAVRNTIGPSRLFNLRLPNVTLKGEKLCDFGRGMVAAASILFHQLNDKQNAFEILKSAGVMTADIDILSSQDREVVIAFRVNQRRKQNNG